MIEAGLEELREQTLASDVRYFLEVVYRAMAYAKVPASSTSFSK
jgi:hypothetical protein